MAASENIKESHKDFYGNDDEKEENDTSESLTTNLIAKQFEQTKKQSEKVAAQRSSSQFLGLSDQPYSKWQAIFNLEEIKERNKPMLAKQSLPKAPFFMFDLDKVMAGDSKTTPNDLLAQTFFTKDQNNENKLEKHGFSKKLRALLQNEDHTWQEIVNYMKTLSPSGIELELISLSSFDIDKTKEKSL